MKKVGFGRESFVKTLHALELSNLADLQSVNVGASSMTEVTTVLMKKLPSLISMMIEEGSLTSVQVYVWFSTELVYVLHPNM